MNPESLTLSEAAALASRFINNTSRNIFLTGKAGTGKTTFLQNIARQTHKNTIIAAPTGIAAINAGGVTLHSLFQLPFGTFIPANTLPQSGNIDIQLNTPDTLLKGLQMHAPKRNLLQEMELLIIDEVSMLRADLLDAIDVVLRSVRRNRAEPFGGVQILFIGDLFQLPPVVKQEEWQYLKQWYDDIWFFSARALKQRPPIYIELNRIFRQTDDRFIELLNHFREDKVTKDDIELLNDKYNPYLQADDLVGFVHLTTHNRKADAINRQALMELPGRIYSYGAAIDGDFGEYLYPVEPVLELKEGAQVMFIKNDYSGESRYFNGKIGTISALSEEEIEVSFGSDEPETLVERYTWENKKYTLNADTNEIEEQIIGTFSHYPVKLAWAITVHKSQGLTFERAVIDVSSAFAPGQIYVALSRLVSLDGLVLSARLPWSRPGPDEAIIQFVMHNENSPLPETILEEEIRSFVRDYVLKTFNLNPLQSRLHYFTESHDKDEKRSVKQTYKDWAAQLESDFKPVAETADKFRDQIRKILLTADNDYLLQLESRLEAAKNYFDPILAGYSDRILTQIQNVGTGKKTKSYLGELKELERLFFKQKKTISKSQGLIRTTLEGTDFSRDQWQDPVAKKDREEQLRKSLGKGRNEKREKIEKNEKREKRERSDKISFEMFSSGKTVAEIARERSLTVSTIEGHLMDYVAGGIIDIFQLVSEEKVSKVLKLAEEMEIPATGTIKDRYGEGISYNEIRLVLAYRKWKTVSNYQKDGRPMTDD